VVEITSRTAFSATSSFTKTLTSFLLNFS